MKTLPPPCPEPETGVQYWRSLDHLADTPEFRVFLEREFPSGASEFTDPVSRRHFVKIMSASFLLAGFGLTGCRRPVEKIMPFSKMPENYAHGVPNYFATAMPHRGGALPLVVKSSDGRPTKIEGNALHPDSNGGTDTFAQASLLDLYDPDRAQRFTKDANTVTRQAAFDFLGSIGARFSANNLNGNGLCFLLNQGSSPSRDRLRAELQKKFPAALWFEYEPVDLDAAADVASSVAGKPVKPIHKLDQARVILSLDADFVGTEEDNLRMIRGFASGRRMRTETDRMNRLYSVESLMTLTGMAADHRLRVPATALPAVAAALAAEIATDNSAVKAMAGRLPLPDSVNPAWIRECAKDLAGHKGASVVLAGHRQPPSVHALAAIMNQALGNIGKTVLHVERPTPSLPGIVELASALNEGKVDTLVIVGGNPVLNAPADLNWAVTQRKAKTVVRLGYYEDETAEMSDWNFPAAHYLESWGDARSQDGTLMPVQPLIEPLFDGVTDLELLARIGGLGALRPHDIARETFRGLTGDGGFEENWKKFLHDGYWAGTGYKPAEGLAFSDDKLAAILIGESAAQPVSRDNLEVIFHRDLKLDDGRYNNNGWLQELPDPVTKLTWDNVVLLSRRTASDLGVKNGDVLRVESGGRSIEGPAWVQPGMADYSLGLALGYGRVNKTRGGTGRVGGSVGLYNAYVLRASSGMNLAAGAKATRTGATHKLACTQEHGSMEGRPIIREANLDQYHGFPGFAKNMDLEAHGATYIENEPGTNHPKKIYENPYKAYEERKRQVGVSLADQVIKSDVHQWGMSIDLNTCVGCAACVIACQSENNIPIVGKDQVRRDREMHWIRIDRYYSGAYDKAAPDQIDNPQAVTQPMLCQHCEDAPCESVCPVNATVHDEEGLNVMAYNRCVGTRYCSNNCPYKVRRFNFFDYNRHPINGLYKTPIGTGHKGSWNMLNWFRKPSEHHTIPDDQWDLMKLVRNPDVSVRMRGIMEKCTFCVQRIEQAKIEQKVAAKASGDVRVREGAVKAACQQACPAGAIVFGNLLDPDSEVSKVKKSNLDYAVLGFLDTRPRTTYLARLRNPNKAMPDYHEHPLNLKEYMDSQHANPFKAHEAHHGGQDSHGKGGSH